MGIGIRFFFISRGKVLSGTVRFIGGVGGGGSGVSLNSPNKSWCQHSWKLSYTALQQTLNSLCENERKYLHHKNLNIA